MENILKELYEFPSKDVGNKTDFDRTTVGTQIYGEILYDSMEYLIKEFISWFNEDTVFYDLGSGMGKIVYHVGVKYNPKKACGIEYSKERHNTAIELGKRFNLERDNIELINGNFLEHDLSDATVVYTDNTAFPQHISQQLYEKLPSGCLLLARRFINVKIKIDKMISGEKVKTGYNTKTVNVYIIK